MFTKETIFKINNDDGDVVAIVMIRTNGAVI